MQEADFKTIREWRVYKLANKMYFNKYNTFERYHSTHYLYAAVAEPVMLKEFGLRKATLTILSACILASTLSHKRFGRTFTTSEAHLAAFYRKLSTVKAHIAILHDKGIIRRSKLYKKRWEFTPLATRITNRYSTLCSKYEREIMSHFGR